jgi:hypothetical protein
MSDDKLEKKLKHLEFIQNVITRMNTNSFMVKGWAVTLVAALFALSSTTNAKNLYLAAFVPVPVFWLLDGFFLATEKRFRDLYDKVRDQEKPDMEFEMNPYHEFVKTEILPTDNRCTRNGKRIGDWLRILVAKGRTWLAATFSITLILFYGVMLGIMFVVKDWLHG